MSALDPRDPHHAAAARAFRSWRTHGSNRVLSVVNLAEVLVGPAANPAVLRRARSMLAALGVRIDQPAELVAVEAARLGSHHAISLADAFCLATSRHLDALVASFDSNLLRAARRESIASVTLT